MGRYHHNWDAMLLPAHMADYVNTAGPCEFKFQKNQIRPQSLHLRQTTHCGICLAQVIVLPRKALSQQSVEVGIVYDQQDAGMMIGRSLPGWRIHFIHFVAQSAILSRTAPIRVEPYLSAGRLFAVI